MDTKQQVEYFFKILGYENNDIIEFRPMFVYINPKGERTVYQDKNNSAWWTPKEWLDNIENLQKINAEKAKHIFFGVHPRKSIGGSKSEDVKECRCFFADFDNLEENTVECVEQRIKDVNIPLPTLLTFTGHGFHAYWCLTNPITPEEWQQPQNNLIDTIKSDPRSKDLARILRIPGFNNGKYDKVEQCFITKIYEKNVYSKDFIKLLREKKKTVSFSSTTSHKEDSNFQLDFDKLDYFKIFEDEGIKYEEKSAAKNHVLLHCIFPEGHDGGEDKNPSFSMALKSTDKYKAGTGKCFTHQTNCVYTILELILFHRDIKNFVNIFIDNKKLYLKRRNKLINELNIKYSGFLKTTLYNASYPGKNCKKIAKKYFSVDEKVRFYWFDGMFYYGINKKYQKFSLEELNSLLWHEYDNAFCTKKSKEGLETVPFPVTQKIVNDTIKAFEGLFRLASNTKGNIIWLTDKIPPGFENTDELVVCENKIINYNKLITTDLTYDLFCPTPIPCTYDISLPKPQRCKRFLIENCKSKEQIREYLKREAFYLYPAYPEDIQVFFVIQGKTGSGKGTYVRFTKFWLGEKNYIESSINSLGDRFGLQSLSGILVIFLSDEEEDSVNKIERGLATLRIKKISGGDEIEVRLPGGKIINIKPSAKICICCTEIPQLSSVEEITRREQVTVFKQQYSFDKEIYPNALNPDENCLTNMITEKNAYFTHYVIGIGMKLLKRKGFKNTKERREIIREELDSGSDFFGEFFDKYTEPATGIIFNNDFVEAFEAHRWTTKMYNQKALLNGVTFCKITKQIRKVRTIETDKINSDPKHRTAVLMRAFTDYGENRVEEYKKMLENKIPPDF